MGYPPTKLDLAGSILLLVGLCEFGLCFSCVLDSVDLDDKMEKIPAVASSL